MPAIFKDILPVVAVFAATFVAGFAATVGARRSAEVPAPFPGAVVVAELFTSEDCPGCMTADRVLAQIVELPLVPGVQVLGLVEPVDYQEPQGSAPFVPFTTRQSGYDERVFHRGSLRTPQIVVDGQVEAIGADFGAIQRAVVRAAQFGKAAVAINATLAPDANELHLSLEITVPAQLPTFEMSQVFVAVTTRQRTSGVRLADRWRLTPQPPAAVVRSLLPIGTMPTGLRTWSTETSIPIPREWKPAELTVVSFLQESESLRIVGAGSATVSAD